MVVIVSGCGVWSSYLEHSPFVPASTHWQYLCGCCDLFFLFCCQKPLLTVSFVFYSDSRLMAYHNFSFDFALNL